MIIDVGSGMWPSICSYLTKSHRLEATDADQRLTLQHDRTFGGHGTLIMQEFRQERVLF